jgi:hypothetical protein
MPASKTKRIPIYTPHSALFCCLGALCPLPIRPTLKGTLVLRFPEEELTSFREDTPSRQFVNRNVGLLRLVRAP